MALKPASTLVVLRTPIADKDGMASIAFLNILQQWDVKLQNGLDQIGQFIGTISPAVQVGGRTGTIGTALQHIDGTGVLAAAAISGTLASGRLPTAAIGAIGGVQANNPVPHKWVNSIDPSGIPALSQPGYGDIAGIPTLPADAPATSHNWVNSYTASTGAFTESQPAFTDISGAATAGQIPALSALSGQITTAQLPAAGVSGTITLAQLTGPGTQGSITLVNGIVTAFVNPT